MHEVYLEHAAIKDLKKLPGEIFQRLIIHIRAWLKPVITSVHAFAVDPDRGVFILALLVIAIGGSLLLFAWRAPALMYFYGGWTVVATLAVLVTRVVPLIRNRRLKHRSTIQTAIGVRHARIVQKSQGFMGGSFNTRDFFHGVAPRLFRSIKWIFLVLVFPLPLALLLAGMILNSPMLIAAAFVVQYLGLLVERWFFFAQATHPQNLYYQTIS